MFENEMKPEGKSLLFLKTVFIRIFDKDRIIPEVDE